MAGRAGRRAGLGRLSPERLPAGRALHQFIRRAQPLSTYCVQEPGDVGGDVGILQAAVRFQIYFPLSYF